MCDSGLDDCDGNSATGCETEVSDDVAHCGGCDSACSNEHGTTTCSDGDCSPICAQGFDDCDGDRRNGCEADLGSALSDCGACGEVCRGANALVACSDGVCQLETCKAGFEDCDGRADNGCEADLSSAETCGSCQSRCNDNGGSASCVDGECGIECDADRADCSLGLLNGCETETNVSVLHCGECDNACPTPVGAAAACLAGVCGESPCKTPLADCNNDYGRPNGDGCETTVTSDPIHCGGCGIECYYPNAQGRCAEGQCALGACNTGFADCNEEPEDGCETRLGDSTNCTACGDACSAVHGTNQCEGEACQPTCAIGWGDCDGKPGNGCETPLNTLANCGACNSGCTRANAAVSCEAGICRITTCQSGYGDCDNEPATKNGCETRLNSLVNCGGCGTPCDLPSAAESCASGSCTLVSCSAGFADCSATLPGCETQLGRAANCASCGNVCQVTGAHVTQNPCSGSSPNWDCAPSCSPGYDSCDDNPDNGCETSLHTQSDCGACNRSCSLPRALSYACPSGECLVASCADGYDNCNTTQVDGCERPVSADVANCGGCDLACDATHGTPACADGLCSISCNSGWGDCNDDVDDGCEHDLAGDRLNCGECGAACPSSAPFCVDQQCAGQLVLGAAGTPTRGVQATTGMDLSIQHTLRNPVGKYRTVLVGVAGRGNNAAGRPRGVQYAGVAMTALREVASSNQAFVAIYAIRDNALPPRPDDYTVLIQVSDPQNSFGLVADVLELEHVEQGPAGVENVGGSAKGDCGNNDPIDSVTTTTSGAWVYGMVSLYGRATPQTGIARSGQIVTLQAETGNLLAGLAGYIPNLTQPGSVTLSWNPDDCSNSAQALIALRAARTP